MANPPHTANGPHDVDPRNMEPAARPAQHPADVADAIEALEPEAGAEVLQALPPQQAADALEQMDESAATEYVEELAPAPTSAMSPPATNVNDP